MNEARQEAERDAPRLPTRIVALLNQKGGVGKTTSTVNLGAALAEAGHRVLLIDLDPQGHLSLHLGIDSSTCGEGVYELLLDPDVGLAQVIQHARPNLDVVPATVDLAAAESELASVEDRHAILKRKFESARDLGPWDYVLLDCPPSLGLLTLNALALAREVIVPMQAHFLALQGLGRLLETVSIVGRGVNPDLRVAGVLLCMHEKQSSHGREVVAELKDFFAQARGTEAAWSDASVFLPAIRRNIKLAEAPSFGQTVLEYAPACPGAMDYRTLATRLVEDWKRRCRTGGGSPRSLATVERVTPPSEPASVAVGTVAGAVA
ncbi:MAG: ParA family protein, partial [Phycisphaerales bacterium]